MATDMLEKVLERLGTIDKTIIVADRELEGEIGVVSGSWDGENAADARFGVSAE